MVVTPAQAEAWLLLNTNNRPRSLWQEKGLERALRAGQWHETHQGIAISEDNVLLDGQTRLWAIVGSGISAVLWVATGVPRDAMFVLDQARFRSIAHNLMVMGMAVSPTMVAVLRVIINGAETNRERLSTDEVKEALTRHGDALVFAMEHFTPGKNKHTPTIVCGLVGRASYTVDREVLREFCSVLISGDSTLSSRQATRVVIQLRDMLMGSHHGRLGRPELYSKASRALRAFADNENLSRLYAAPTELFQIPDQTPQLATSHQE